MCSRAAFAVVVRRACASALSRAVLLSAVLMGCTVKTLPPGSRIIDRVDVHGSEKVDDDEVKDKIATTETKHALFGILEGTPILTIFDAMTVEYHTYDRLVLTRDLGRVRRFYQARGFYDVEVTAGRVVRTKGNRVRVEIHVREGEPVLIDDVTFDFPSLAHSQYERTLVGQIIARYQREPIDDPEPRPRFDEDRYEALKAEVERALTDRGLAYAEVTGEVDVDLAKRGARVAITIVPGPRCTFGDVSISGLGEIPESPVRGALGFEKGQLYSSGKMEQAQYALADLQVFGSVEIVAKRSPAGTERVTAVPIVVNVQPIKLRAIKVGVGGEVGSRVEAHVVAGWEDRNFIGGLRRFGVDARPGLVFFPLRAENLFSPPDDLRLVPEVSVEANFKQPAFPEARTNMLVSTGARIYRPRTLPDPENFDDAVDNVVGYREIDGAFGFDRKFRFRFWGGSTIYAAQFIKLQFDDPFSYNLPDAPVGFERVLIPYLETVANWDFRKNADGKLDPFNASEGVFFGVNAQFAGGFLQGDADDIRLRPEFRAFIPLGDRVVLAGRWATGFLFPRNYGESLPAQGASETARARDLQLLSFRGFFSGGPSSNRGYGFRDVGPYEVLPFLSQLGTSTSLQPTGGLGMWELSGEIRILLTENLVGVLFLDSSDVVRTLSDYRLTHPHISPGLGFRLRLPIGSLRFDLGFRPPYLQKIGSEFLEPEEGGPLPDESPGVPLAFHLAIGEAF
jgi:outer membrane protein insertion porin family/translocation and assembly module TamA